MAGCAMFGCKSYLRGRAVTLYALPTDPVVASQWIGVIKRSRGDLPWKDNKRISLCSDHFDYKDMCGVGIRRQLIKGSVPTRIHVTEEDLERDKEREIANKSLIIKLEPVEPEYIDPLLTVGTISIEYEQENVDDLDNKSLDDLVSNKRDDDSPVVEKLRRELETSRRINQRQRRANKQFTQKIKRLELRFNSLKRLTKGLVNILKHIKENEVR